MGIVVTGIGMVSALGLGVEQAIGKMRQGRSGISSYPVVLTTGNRLPVGELPMTNGELHALAGIPETEHLSRTALLGILATREALSDAHVDGSKRIGLVSATSVGGMDLTEHFFVDFLRNPQSGRLRNVRMHDCAASTDAIARYAGINGYVTTVSTACSSAANAIMMGVKLLKHRLVDCVVAGGCDALSTFTLNGFKSLMILDEQPCRPFDEHRAGLNLGEGAGYVVMQREEEVDAYYGHLVGYANRNDAYHQTASSATGDGAYLAMREALAMTGLSPADVGYINVHGTGTANNDAAESAALIRLFGEKMPPFSSTKGFTGHTLAAAGGIEAVLSVLSVKRGYVYPNIRFSTPITGYGLVPQCDFGEYNNTGVVLTNSFGFGGNCSALVFMR
ncbi:MAG: beta-ketoacyl-[acyl-carrier-protein] synthase family protein [Bacteroidales bacterium]|nr:beta-ketoacyl-[acyl-carrier-protein] synthase family protein [Bacteroidales bacterium]